MDQPPPRTLLDQIIRRVRRTMEEECDAFARTAREAKEDVSLSQRQLSRWLSGRVRRARPAGQRVAEIHWGFDFDTLMGPPLEGYDAAGGPSGWAMRGLTRGGQEASGGAGEPAPVAGGEAGPRQAETLFRELLGPRALATPVAAASASTLQEIDLNEFVEGLVTWLRQVNPAMGRRDMLAKLSAAVAVAGAGPLFDIVDPDERERLARVLHDPTRVDATTLRHYTSIVTGLRRQADMLGPGTTLQTILAQRHLVRGLAAAAPPELRPLALSLHAELSQLAGWSMFNLGDPQNALYYYEDARAVAHDAQNIDLVTYVLCEMSRLATWRGKSRIGIDHAVAATAWAGQIDSPHARAYAAGAAVWAYCADKQLGKCPGTLAQVCAAIKDVASAAPASLWWYFVDESFYWNEEAAFELELKRPDAALHAVGKSLDLLDPAHLHNHTFRLLRRAEAYIQKSEVVEASVIIGDVAGLPAVRTSKRFGQRIMTLRGALTPWETSTPVRELDERLMSCQLSL